jgi:hypothetical protein
MSKKYQKLFREEVLPGKLVVHIGAKPNGFRARLVVDTVEMIDKRSMIVFADGRSDWLDQWRVFDGWEEYGSR